MANRKRQMWIWMMAALTMLMMPSCSSDREPFAPEPMTRPTKVVINIPSDLMPTYQKRADGQTRAEGLQLSLRAVIEIYNQGSTQLISHRNIVLIPTAVTNVYYFELDDLNEGDYDIYVWADFSADGSDLFYNTESLQAVQIISKPFDSNQRRAYMGKTTISVDNDVLTHQSPVKMKSPFAHYRIEAIDVAEYEQMKHANGWPELEDLLIRITYMSYVPTSFNILTGQPNDAEQGISFTCGTSNQYNGKVIVSDDYVFVTGSESSVIVKVEIINPATDEVIACAENVKIDYRQGYVTIVSGNFLTTDSSLDGAIGIDTRWEGEFNVEF